MLRTKTINCLFIIFLFSGCYIIPCGWDSDLEKIKGILPTNDLIGVYRLDERSQQVVPGYEKINKAEIRLLEEGKLTFKNILMGTFDFEKLDSNDNKLVNGTGEWSIGENDGEEEFFVSLDSIGSSNGYSTSFRLYKKENKYVIFIVVGDPDACSAARFFKQ